MTIWKYVIPWTGEHAIQMRANARILSAGFIGSEVVVWALVDPTEGDATRWVAAWGTGWEFDSTGWEFLATVVVDDKYAWHIWVGQ